MPSAADLVRTVVIDFDGTICPADVSEALLEAFSGPGWREIDDAFVRGDFGSRECLLRQGALLPAGRRSEMVAHAIEHCPLDPTFGPFVDWAHARGIRVVVASDGFGFYIDPMLEAAGTRGVEVRGNRSMIDRPPPAFSFPHAHPECRTCGTCKLLVVQEARRSGPVAFVGEGHTDRYGALYADVTFAKDALVGICLADEVPFVPWDSFDDVRSELEQRDALPGPVGPARCPGWPRPDSGP
jgi:2-hydroxy-3-keto-5-methylthiopentenyl-1-phosphate phosphatase